MKNSPYYTTPIFVRAICDLCRGDGCVEIQGDSGFSTEQCGACEGLGVIERTIGEINLAHGSEVPLLTRQQNG